MGIQMLVSAAPKVLLPPIAQMIPAQSTASGSNPINSFGSRNVDMDGMKNGWPSSRDDFKWRHSDVREIAYTYTFSVFDKIVLEGNLNQ